MIRDEFPDLKEFLSGKSFWANDYFAEACGQINEARIREYVQNQ